MAKLYATMLAEAAARDELRPSDMADPGAPASVERASVAAAGLPGDPFLALVETARADDLRDKASADASDEAAPAAVVAKRPLSSVTIIVLGGVVIAAGAWFFVTRVIAIDPFDSSVAASKDSGPPVAILSMLQAAPAAQPDDAAADAPSSQPAPMAAENVASEAPEAPPPPHRAESVAIPADTASAQVSLMPPEVQAEDQTPITENAAGVSIATAVAEEPEKIKSSPAAFNETPGPSSSQRGDDSPAAATIGLFLRRGTELLREGDFTAARLYLERAAAAGDAGAVRALGESYDPLYLRQFRIRGAAGDAAKAVVWYRAAIRAGDAESEARLARLLAK